MNRNRIMGAVSFPAYLLAWATGAALVVDQLPLAIAERTDGQTPRALPGDLAFEAVPAELNLSFDDPDAWNGAIRDFARTSDVMNGTWGPGRHKAVLRAPDGRAGPRPEPARLRVADARVEPQSVPPQPAPQRQARPEPAPAPAPAKATPPASKPAARPAPRSTVVKVASSGAPRLARLKSQARRSLEAGRFADAYHTLRPNVGEASGDAEYLALLAVSAMRLSSYGEAMVIYERLARIQPGRPRWHMGLAMAREGLGMDAGGGYREALALSDGADEVTELLRAKLSDREADLG